MVGVGRCGLEVTLITSLVHYVCIFQGYFNSLNARVWRCDILWVDLISMLCYYGMSKLFRDCIDYPWPSYQNVRVISLYWQLLHVYLRDWSSDGQIMDP